MDDPLDKAVLLQMPDRRPSERTVDFESLDEDTLADKLEGGHFFEDTIVGRFIQSHGVLGLVLDLSFRPLLLLCRLSSPSSTCCCFCFGLEWGRRLSTAQESKDSWH